MHTTVLPCLASCFSNLTHCTVVTVSSPLVGSSKKNTGGLFTSSSAMDNLRTKLVCFKTKIVTVETDGFFRGKGFLMPVDVYILQKDMKVQNLFFFTITVNKWQFQFKHLPKRMQELSITATN